MDKNEKGKEQTNCQHKTIISAEEEPSGNSGGNEKMRTRETVIAVLKHNC